VATADQAGTLGSVTIRLHPDTPAEERYQRRYVPVRPESREIAGTGGDQIAPETSVAQWHIDDWSAGEGNLRWIKDEKRYNQSSGVHPSADGSGLEVAYELTTTQEQGASDFPHGLFVVRAGSRLLTAYESDDKLYEWDATNEEWDPLWTISATAGNKVRSIGAVDDSAIFVRDDDARTYKVTSGGYTTHFTGKSWHLMSYQGVLYGLSALDLSSIDTSTASTATLVADVAGNRYPAVQNAMVTRITTSDVGIVWVAPFNDGRVELWEYNVADDTSYVVAQLPRDVQPYSVAFHMGIYFVGFRYAAEHTEVGDAYLYYKAGGSEGAFGPFPATTTASKSVEIAGVIGDRMFIVFDGRIWAYDLSAGAIAEVHPSISTRDQLSNATTFGKDMFVAGVSTSKIERLDTTAFDTSVSGTVDLGRYDFRYLGLKKNLTTVTVVCETALGSSDSVGLKYAVDGGSFSTATGTMGSGDTTKTWTISSNSSTVRGYDFELQLTMAAGATTSSPKVVSVTAEAEGSEDRIEWVLSLDLTDNMLNQAQVVMDGLNTLKTNHATVQFSDPWNQPETDAADTYDVDVLDVVLPVAQPEGDTARAIVKLRTSGTV
jgi:hypothetical protein